MKKVYYEKIGRKYVPVSEYDGDYHLSFPKGNHLVMCYPGGSSRRFNVEPALAALLKTKCVKLFMRQLPCIAKSTKAQS
jgi:hypothetical protein